MWAEHSLSLASSANTCQDPRVRALIAAGPLIPLKEYTNAILCFTPPGLGAHS